MAVDVSCFSQGVVSTAVWALQDLHVAVYPEAGELSADDDNYLLRVIKNAYDNDSLSLCL